MQGKCEYPGCTEQANIACCMIGCNHKVCFTHGNCSYELTPDSSVSICWYCCGKGWGEDDFYEPPYTRADEEADIANAAYWDEVARNQS